MDETPNFTESIESKPFSVYLDCFIYDTFLIVKSMLYLHSCGLAVFILGDFKTLASYIKKYTKVWMKNLHSFPI